MTTRAAILVDRLRRLQKTPRIIWDCVILLIVGHFLTEVASILAHIAPHWSLVKVDWFWSPNFHMQMERQWYIKYFGDSLLWIITYYIMAKIAAQFSNALFIVAFIFWGYHVLDGFFFWWDFNSDFYIYLDLLWTAGVLVKYAIFPYKEEKFAKIKSLF